MVCENPRIIYVRKKYPTYVRDEDHLHQLNKPSMSYKKGWQQIKVPCGKCDCCKMDKANHHSTRIVNEFETWDNVGFFLTLSYNNPNLPMTKEGLTTLRKKDIQDFKKRLRKYVAKHELAHKEWRNPYNGKIQRPIRTFECGEYGYNGTRAAIGGNPHYHMIIMNWIPDDLEFDKISKKSGMPVFTSKTIDELWGKGYAPIGYITYESAAYVARYTMKKNGLAKIEREYYDVEEMDKKTGVFKMKRKWHNKKGIQESEFITMSQGIGRMWFINNIEKIKQNDCIIIKTGKGTVYRTVPRYYRKVWQQINWMDYERWRYKCQKKYEIEEQKEIDKFNLPEEWLRETKIFWISQKKIADWKAKRERLRNREVA